jgi:hypothetical protein
VSLFLFTKLKSRWLCHSKYTYRVQEKIMQIYQILDEQNNPVAEYSSLDYALHNAENLTFWHTDHYYHVEEIELIEH